MLVDIVIASDGGRFLTVVTIQLNNRLLEEISILSPVSVELRMKKVKLVIVVGSVFSPFPADGLMEI